MAIGYVRYHPDHETIWLYSRESRARGARVRDVRWGDHLNLSEGSTPAWSKVKWGSKTYFIPTEDVSDVRPLEVLFVDVGQGDGCILTSAETGDAERIIIIDAGKSDNMFKLVKWRFGKLKSQFDFDSAIITHPDEDHYGGFLKLFRFAKIGFRRVYHNGIMERAGPRSQSLGPSDSQDDYLTDIIVTDEDARALYADAAVRGAKKYPKLIQTAIDSGRIGPIEMLAVGHGQIEGEKTYLPGFSPSDAKPTKIRVIGPVPEPRGGKPRLRWFGGTIGSKANDVGKTKNGHSVLLRLDIGMFSLLFGGDLNRPAEDYLLRHYGKVNAHAPLSDAINRAQRTLGADMLKCCHHGAADVTDEFLRAVNARGFVVSSGDDESHAHPRPDLLGRLGKFGRGDAPMIFCTEILRSTRETGVSEDFMRLRKIDKEINGLHVAIDELEDAGQDATELRQALKDKNKGRIAFQKSIQKRNVGVYGAITLRTDGHRMEISFMLEKPRGKQRWQSFRLEHDPQAEEWYDVRGGGAH